MLTVPGLLGIRLVLRSIVLLLAVILSHWFLYGIRQNPGGLYIHALHPSNLRWGAVQSLDDLFRTEVLISETNHIDYIGLLRNTVLDLQTHEPHADICRLE